MISIYLRNKSPGFFEGITKEFGITTIINTHDMNSVMGIGENIIFIYEGTKEWQGVSSQIMHSDNTRLTDFIFASDLLKNMRQLVLDKESVSQ